MSRWAGPTILKPFRRTLFMLTTSQGTPHPAPRRGTATHRADHSVADPVVHSSIAGFAQGMEDIRDLARQHTRIGQATQTIDLILALTEADADVGAGLRGERFAEAAEMHQAGEGISMERALGRSREQSEVPVMHREKLEVRGESLVPHRAWPPYPDSGSAEGNFDRRVRRWRESWRRCDQMDALIAASDRLLRAPAATRLPCARALGEGA